MSEQSMQQYMQRLRDLNRRSNERFHIGYEFEAEGERFFIHAITPQRVVECYCYPVSQREAIAKNPGLTCDEDFLDEHLLVATERDLYEYALKEAENKLATSAMPIAPDVRGVYALVATLETHHGTSLAVSLYSTREEAGNHRDDAAANLDYDEEEAASDEVFDWDVFCLPLDVSQLKPFAEC